MLILFFLVFLKNDIGVQVRQFVILGIVLKTVGAVGLIASAGILRRTLTAIPIPKESGKLSTSGLYRFARHPMYSALLVFSLGIALGAGTAMKYALFCGLFVLLFFKSRFEESFLVQKYPEYEDYANRTPRFFPRLR
jgi:protein-S-isoprenylcysteine O-methyltransferase Ste14